MRSFKFSLFGRRFELTYSEAMAAYLRGASSISLMPSPAFMKHGNPPSSEAALEKDRQRVESVIKTVQGDFDKALREVAVNEFGTTANAILVSDASPATKLDQLKALSPNSNFAEKVFEHFEKIGQERMQLEDEKITRELKQWIKIRRV